MTDTTKLDEIVFTESVTYIATECPEWCTEKPLHPCENGDPAGRGASRFHTGPRFGEYLRVDGEEWADAPGEVEASVELYVESDVNGAYVKPEQLRQLALDALAAAEWLEAHR